MKLLQLCPDFLTTMLFHITKYTKFWSAVQYNLKMLLLSKLIYAFSHLRWLKLFIYFLWCAFAISESNFRLESLLTLFPMHWLVSYYIPPGREIFIDCEDATFNESILILYNYHCTHQVSFWDCWTANGPKKCKLTCCELHNIPYNTKNLT